MSKELTKKAFEKLEKKYHNEVFLRIYWEVVAKRLLTKEKRKLNE